MISEEPLTLDFEAPAKVLCLDDEESVLRSLTRVLRGSNLLATTFTDGQSALEALRQTPFEVIISDMRMPNMSGDEFLEKARAIAPNCQRILLTGYADLNATVNAVNKGGINAYLQKPWQNDQLIQTVKEAVEKYRLKQQNLQLLAKIEAQNNQLKELNTSLEALVDKRTKQIRQVLKQLEVAHEHEQRDHKATVEVLYNFINANPYLDAELAKKVAQTCRGIGKQLKLSNAILETVSMAGYLAQVGLLAMDPEVYKVSVNQLSDEKRKLFYTHPAIAQLMLMPAPHLSEVSEGIYHQFEKYNGNGIPKGLRGQNIPITAHILAVARDYQQHIHDSNLPKSARAEHALEMIKLYSGNFYHPKVVTALEQHLQNVKSNPSEQVGSMDIISSAELQPGMTLGLAIHSHKGIMLLPKGHVFSDKSIAKLQQLEAQRPTPFRIMVK
ncbi:HD domain-containing phosphohydrolase [Pseudoalteromonas fenneropenaei]|uniref:HD domain-containing phosphohydrolase n=1 Tax=Pseudoalteromonas fenneropenaei TaxID=1737459 RepID=A0ABV7CG61_9GAMM